MGRYSRFWEMREGSKRRAREVFKCTDCGAVTEHPMGHSGEPDESLCSDGCRSRAQVEDWRPGAVSEAYRKNYDRIFRRPRTGWGRWTKEGRRENGRKWLG